MHSRSEGCPDSVVQVMQCTRRRSITVGKKKPPRLRQISRKDERFILTHGLRGFNVWSLGHDARHHEKGVVEGRLCPGDREAGRKERRGRRRT